MLSTLHCVLSRFTSSPHFDHWGRCCLTASFWAECSTLETRPFWEE